MKQTQRSMLAFSLLLALSLCACTSESSLSVSAPPSEEQKERSSVILQETEDAGDAYLDRFIFFGESTTYHLKSRGVLSGGTETKQVWGPDNGTVNLDSTVTTLRIRYPDTGDYLTVGEAMAQKRPDFLLLTFGLNGAPYNLKRGKEAYLSVYRTLLDELQAASPTTQILLQSCFPVAANMDMSHYSLTLDELNDAIRTINQWTLSLAEEYDLPYLNTAEILTDEDGRLKSDYQNGDGYHLTRAAYLDILTYIRTHSAEGWKRT